MFCSQCGTQAATDARFCHQCGSAIANGEAIQPAQEEFDPVAERWVPVGALREMLSEPSKMAKVEAAVEMIPFVEFDSSVIPKPGDLVPTDCVWAWDAHPGPYDDAYVYGDVMARLAAIGTLRGRLAEEVMHVAGQPTMSSATPDGGMVAVWQHGGGLFQKLRSIALQFDRYGVCMGVNSEVTI